jgi:deoxyribonuclease V
MKESVYSWALDLQKEIATKITYNDKPIKIKNICAVDVSYKNEIAYCSAVIMNKALDLIDTINFKSIVKYAYIPGLFFLRESGPIFGALEKLRNDYDLLIIDGHGTLHPRKCGLASYVGYLVNKPTIGVAKSRLCGSVREDQFIEYDDKVLGYRIRKKGKKDLYVSVGHKISLRLAVEIVQKLIKSEERLPEPLRIADLYSKDHSNFSDIFSTF